MRLIEAAKVFAQHFATEKGVPSLKGLTEYDFHFIVNNSDYEMRATWNKRFQTVVEKLGIEVRATARKKISYAKLIMIRGSRNGHRSNTIGRRSFRP